MPWQRRAAISPRSRVRRFQELCREARCRVRLSICEEQWAVLGEFRALCAAKVRFAEPRVPQFSLPGEAWRERQASRVPLSILAQALRAPAAWDARVGNRPLMLVCGSLFFFFFFSSASVEMAGEQERDLGAKRAADGAAHARSSS